MSINEIFKLLCKNPGKFIRVLLLKYARLVNDQKLLLRLLYKEHIGVSLNLQNPKTFTEKIQWLKLYDHNSIYHIMVDKYEVKKWVAERIGEKYIIPTIGIYNSFDEIDFQLLPNQFVLKNTAGGVEAVSLFVMIKDRLISKGQRSCYKIRWNMTSINHWANGHIKGSLVEL